MNFVISNENIHMPNMINGTAWKKDKTSNLVYEALKQGFKGIDTAGQPRHYQEKLVGDGIKKAIDDNLIKRDELFIQMHTPDSFGRLAGELSEGQPINIRKASRFSFGRNCKFPAGIYEVENL